MPEASKGGLENVVVGNSEICWIDGQIGELLYRGYDIKDLADNVSFEETCYLLWHGKLPNADELTMLDNELRSYRSVPQQVIDLIYAMPKNEEPMSQLRTAISFLGAFDDDTGASDPMARMRKAKRLTTRFPIVVAAIARARNGEPMVQPREDLSHAANFLYMLWNKVPDADSIRAMDVALILHAEHGFNASTFTARVIAATESDMYSAVTGAIGALKGPLHGGANTEVIHMLLEIGEPEKVEAYVAAKLAKKEKIMGMGHRVYKTTDPRAKVLFDLSKTMGERIGVTKWLSMSEKIQSIVHAQKGLYPNVDFYSASTYYTMGIDPEIYTLLFAVSRISGWSAHIIEQLSNNRLIRPRAEYVGPKGLKFVKLEDRP
jgi:citrate synthase